MIKPHDGKVEMYGIDELITSFKVISPVLVLALGFTIGMQHAFEADHVAAIATQLSKSKRKNSLKQLVRESLTKSSIVGIIWGAGHTTTLVLVGILVYVLALTIEDEIFAGFELGVGVMLLFLGLSIIRKKIKLKHKHPHKHQDGSLHFDEHTHNDPNHHHNHRPYLIGLMHGLAGSGSLVVLTAATLNDVSMVLEFIIVFGVGSMLGMAIVGSMLGIPFALGDRYKAVQKYFNYAIGLVSVFVGINVIYETVLSNLGEHIM